MDVLGILLLMAVVIGSSAHAPSNSYAYSQERQMGASLSTARTGEWLLPRSQYGQLARKPQLYAWLDAPVLLLTGWTCDFAYRVPTILAALGSIVLLYFFARRWYGRTTALLAACLWAASIHMSKMAYLGTTDMLMSFWILASIFCADRLLYRRALRHRGAWATAFWATIILGSLSKGWGVANVPIVAGVIAIASALGPGFEEVRECRGLLSKFLRAAALVGSRWIAAAKDLRLGWGLLATALVLGPLWAVMLHQGGEEFRKIVYFEIFQRATGQGEGAPRASKVPPFLQLVYYQLPASIPAIAALALVSPRRWFRSDSPVWLPLSWVVAVVGLFSLAHGFRADYLLPCYPAVAMMGAWAIQRVYEQGPSGGKFVRLLRHVFAGGAITAASVLILLPCALVFHDHMPRGIQKNIHIPAAITPLTWNVLTWLIPAGAILIVLTVIFSLRWQVRRVAVTAMLAMLGVQFLDTHVISRHAQIGDGERMIEFARQSREILHGERPLVYQCEKFVTEPYLGEFGIRLHEMEIEGKRDVPKETREVLAGVNASSSRWLITCDHALVELGAAKPADKGPYQLKVRKQDVSFQTMPQELGEVRCASEPIQSQKWGRIYLIEVRRPVQTSAPPYEIGFIPGVEVSE
jgi:4-amino-4-deoxy-L-arabinose transferase-like glycosyltransferase